MENTNKKNQIDIEKAAETFAQILIQQAMCKKRSRQSKKVFAGNLPVFPSK